MRKVFYNKLVRDRIPASIREQGARYSVQKLSKQQFQLELLKKVGEEASSLPKLTVKKDVVSEIADIYDVIDALKKELKISKSEIRRAQEQAFASKGGFRKQLFLFWAEYHQYKTNERRYVKRRRGF